MPSRPTQGEMLTDVPFCQSELRLRFPNLFPETIGHTFENNIITQLKPADRFPFKHNTICPDRPQKVAGIKLHATCL